MTVIYSTQRKHNKIARKTNPTTRLGVLLYRTLCYVRCYLFRHVILLRMVRQVSAD